MSWGLALFSAIGGACVPPGDSVVNGLLQVEAPEVEESSPMALIFKDASERWNVPVDVLKALAYAETAFEPAVGEVEFEGQEQPFGLFALRGAELERGAALAGYSVERVQGDDEANVHAAAALLNAYAGEAGLDVALRKEPGVWIQALRLWGGIQADEHRREFARDVIAHVGRGVAVPMLDGTTMTIGRDPSVRELISQEMDTTASGLRANGTVWRPSPNYSSRRGFDVDMVIIHSCEGAYAGCVGWLRDTRAQASAHYVVNESGTETAALVDESQRAWHIAASYRSSLNGGVLSSLNGYSSNNFTVGIEHAGRASQSRWPEAQIAASVRLVQDITARNNIPRDRYHIVSHGRLQPESRVDPGANWPWTSYLAAISAGASSSPGTTPASQAPRIISIDNSTADRFRASANWATSAWAAGRVGSDYRYRAAENVYDPAEFRIPLAEGGRYEVFTRVPGNGYTTDQPFVIRHAGGSTAVRRNISASGASWVSLGTFDFAAGDDWIVAVSSRSIGTGWIVADAIRFERR